MKHKLFAVTSVKGGVGKTSLAVHLSLTMAKKGLRVLACDLDHNNNATDFFLRDSDVSDIEALNIKQVFIEKIGIEDAIWKITKNGITLDVLPATPALWTIGQELITEPMALSRFTSHVRTLDYDAIVFDTPPARCFELQAALYSADFFLFPVSPNRWIIQNYNLILNELRKVEQSTGRNPTVNVVPYMVSPTSCDFVKSVNIWTSTETAFPRDAAVPNSTDAGKRLKDGGKADILFSALVEEIFKIK